MSKTHVVYRVQPAAIHLIWSKILTGIQEAAPVTNSRSAQAYTNVLAALVSERAQCFVVADPTQDPPAVRGFLITILQSDPLTSEKHLLIYVAYGFEHIPEEAWDKVYEALAKFAKANSCTGMIAFTKNPVVVKLCLRYGALQDIIFLHKEF